MRQAVTILSFLFSLPLLLSGCLALELEKERSRDSDILQEQQLATKRDYGSYYYYFDERIYLKERKDLIAICFQDEYALQMFISKQGSISSLKIWQQSQTGIMKAQNPYNLLVLQSDGSEITNKQRKELESLPEVRYVSPMLGETDNHLSSVSNEFSVKLRNFSDYSSLESLSKQYNSEVIRYEGFDEGIFFVRLPKDSEFGVIGLSAIFYETGLFDYTSPCFFWFGAMHSVDPYYSNQWGLKNTAQYGQSGIDINVEAAWSTTEGSSDIVVAVLDCGVELTHPDLAANLEEGYDAVDTTSVLNGAPANLSAYHGTAVAGIIGAKSNNGIGIKGVAPGCKIMPVCIAYSSPVYYPAAVRGFNWARTHGADVINCSWSGGNPCALLTGAIHNATTLGRDGKGCVVIFSAGNDGVGVPYPASLYYVMAVGAVSFDGKRKTSSSPDNEIWWSSNYGSTLDVMAPGVFIPTTDIAGEYGINNQLLSNLNKGYDYSDKNYTLWFNGTSAAAPHVAGIAALILSEYPDLPQEYVRRAIEMGCIRHSAYTYVEDGEYPMDYRNDEVGHGLVRANLALGMAGLFDVQNTLDHTPGLDFTILNSSSYPLEDVIVDVRGTIGNQTEWLISSDIYGGIGSGYQVGYPVYRGSSLYAMPGTPITDISFELFASCIDSPGELEIGVAFDMPTPNTYEHFSFGLGETYQKSLPDITVPNGTRRRIYVRIFDVNQQ